MTTAALSPLFMALFAESIAFLMSCACWLLLSNFLNSLLRESMFTFPFLMASSMISLCLLISGRITFPTVLLESLTILEIESRV